MTFKPTLLQENILHHSSNEYGDVLVFKNFSGQNRYLVFCTPDEYRDSEKIAMQSQILTSNKNYIICYYLQLMLASLYFIKNPSKILLIGLGGGTIARAINFLLPNSSLDIVEINPDIINIAKKYFDYYPNENTKIYAEDGIEFIKNNGEYDLIFVDVNCDCLDTKCTTKEFVIENFIKNLQKSLNKNGVLVMNNYDDNESNLLKTNIGNIFANNFVDLHVHKEENSKLDYHSILVTINSDEKPTIEQIKIGEEYWGEKFAELEMHKEFLIDRINKALFVV